MKKGKIVFTESGYFYKKYNFMSTLFSRVFTEKKTFYRQDADNNEANTDILPNSKEGKLEKSTLFIVFHLSLFF